MVTTRSTASGARREISKHAAIRGKARSCPSRKTSCWIVASVAPPDFSFTPEVIHHHPDTRQVRVIAIAGCRWTPTKGAP